MPNLSIFSKTNDDSPSAPSAADKFLAAKGVGAEPPETEGRN
jgi:hypothetical protein